MKKIFFTLFLFSHLSYSQVDSILRIDKTIGAIIPANAKVEKLGGGFKFTEGPVWDKREFLLFSDIPANTIYKWQEEKGFSVFKNPSGQSNGLAYDPEGRLLVCEHKNRRLTRIEKDSSFTSLVEKFEEKKLNSPNDLVIKSNGTIYFTDPPWGLKKQNDDSLKELKSNGVYKLKDGKIELIVSSTQFPNGIALSPDEKYLYYSILEKEVDMDKDLWYRCKIKAGDGIEKPQLFFDASSSLEKGGPDGMKTDMEGNLYCTGPGGLWILSPKGKHLGTVIFPELPSNCAWGDKDGKTMYVTARTGIYRIRFNIPGVIHYK